MVWVQVIAMDARHCRDHLAQNQLVLDHIRRFRERAPYSLSVPIVFIPENMTGMFHTRMEEAMHAIPNAQVLYQNGRGKAGVCKDAFISKGYVERTLDILVHRQIMFDAQWTSVTAAAHKSGPVTGRTKLLTELKEQLLRYGYDDKGKLTGKYDGLFNDDLCITFMMLMYWSQAVERPGAGNPYAHLRRVPGGFTSTAPHTPGVPRYSDHYPAYQQGPALARTRTTAQRDLRARQRLGYAVS